MLRNKNEQETPRLSKAQMQLAVASLASIINRLEEWRQSYKNVSPMLAIEVAVSKNDLQRILDTIKTSGTIQREKPKMGIKKVRPTKEQLNKVRSRVALLKNQLAKDLNKENYDEFDKKLWELSDIASDVQWDNTVQYLENYVDELPTK